MVNRLWPPELAELMDDRHAVPVAKNEGDDRSCINCGGVGIMMVYVWRDGPYQSPGNLRAKWLDLPEGAGWYTGEMKAAFCPVCKANGMAEYLAKNSGLEGQGLDVALEGFRTRGPLEKKALALAQAERLVEMGNQPRGMVTFWGGYGVGKTHLLQGVVNGFRKQGVLAQYRMLANLLAEIRERYGDEHGSVRPEDVIRAMQRVRVLCLDEVDRFNRTPWAQEVVARLIDARYSQGQGLTVLATNLAPAEFPDELGYIASRMRSGVLVNVPGPDVREIMGAKARMDYGTTD